jgi:hypothetical protein
MLCGEKERNLIFQSLTDNDSMGLRFRFLIHRNRPVALKTGVDNPRATL